MATDTTTHEMDPASAQIVLSEAGLTLVVCLCVCGSQGNSVDGCNKGWTATIYPTSAVAWQEVN